MHESIICPTVLAENAHTYREQIERIQPFATRVQIDLMDGEFAPSKSIMPVQVWWPENWQVDIHLMFQRPLEHLETLISHHPHMVIIHAEAEGDLAGMMRHLQKLDIKAGVALLKDTSPEEATELVKIADHVLLFSGDLGHFGGTADMLVLDKVPEVKGINPQAEIGWDGGANGDNVAALVAGGVNVINVGGAIQKAPNPQRAYDTIRSKIS